LQASSYRGERSCICRSQPAGEWWPSTIVSAGKDSLAGKLLQGKSQVFAFVGAGLLANGGGQRASPQANIRLGDGALLVIDEIQKVANWPETIKALWDAQPGRLRVLLVGSSALQIRPG
jgi:hypothetical protein